MQEKKIHFVSENIASAWQSRAGQVVLDGKYRYTMQCVVTQHVSQWFSESVASVIVIELVMVMITMLIHAIFKTFPFVVADNDIFCTLLKGTVVAPDAFAVFVSEFLEFSQEFGPDPCRFCYDQPGQLQRARRRCQTAHVFEDIAKRLVQKLLQRSEVDGLAETFVELPYLFYLMFEAVRREFPVSIVVYVGEEDTYSKQCSLRQLGLVVSGAAMIFVLELDVGLSGELHALYGVLRLSPVKVPLGHIVFNFFDLVENLGMLVEKGERTMGAVACRFAEAIEHQFERSSVIGDIHAPFGFIQPQPRLVGLFTTVIAVNINRGLLFVLTVARR